MTSLWAAGALTLIQDSDELKEAITKLADASGYTFQGKQKGNFAGGVFVQLGKDGGGGGDEDGGASKIDGKFEKGVGMTCSVDDMEYVRLGKKAASRPSPKWTRIDDEAGPSDLARVARKAAGRVMSFSLGGGGGGGLAGMKAPVPPHEELAGWDLRNVSKENKERVGDDLCSIYKAELSPEDAKKLLTWGRWAGAAGGFEMNVTAKLRVLVNSEGRIRLVELETKTSMDLGGGGGFGGRGGWDTSAKRTLEISEFGSTKVEIPEDVKRLLEEK